MTISATPPERAFTLKLQALLLAAAACLIPDSAHAYVDPGSGMLLWQGLIALIGAVLVFARNPWQTIKHLIERLRKK